MNYEKYLPAKCSHRAYYAQFVSPNIKEVVRSNIGIKALLASRVPAFNDIPLEKWDGLAMPLLFNYSDLQFAGEWSTLGVRVCILKEAAQQPVDEVTALGIQLESWLTITVNL